LLKCVLELTVAAIELFAQIGNRGGHFAALGRCNAAPFFRPADGLSTPPSHVTLWAVK
jgi:hypothetical protein